MKVRNVSISVAHNDRVDIKCGGPTYLGFDFVIESKTPKYWRTFFNKMKNLRPDFPFFSMNISRPYEREESPKWDEKSIEKEIKGYTI